MRWARLRAGSWREITARRPPGRRTSRSRCERDRPTCPVWWRCSWYRRETNLTCTHHTRSSLVAAVDQPQKLITDQLCSTYNVLADSIAPAGSHTSLAVCVCVCGNAWTSIYYVLVYRERSMGNVCQCQPTTKTLRSQQNMCRSQCIDTRWLSGSIKLFWSVYDLRSIAENLAIEYIIFFQSKVDDDSTYWQDRGRLMLSRPNWDTIAVQIEMHSITDFQLFRTNCLTTKTVSFSKFVPSTDIEIEKHARNDVC